jgi:hypothetical protein
MLIGMANSKRRWVQLSLRTVLLLVTLLCVALSLWVVPAERQRRAVAAIEPLGGSVTYAPAQAADQASPITFLRRWLPMDYFHAVTLVAFSNAKDTDAGLAHLQGLTGLQAIDLSGTRVTDVGLAHLQGLTGLQALWLNGTKVTDAGLDHLQGLTNLRRLHLGSRQVTDTGLAHLQGLTGLQALDLSGTQVTDAGLVHLQGLTGLQRLDLDNTAVTDAGVAKLRKRLPNCIVNWYGR